MSEQCEAQTPIKPNDTPIVDAFYAEARARFDGYAEWTPEDRYFGMVGELLGKARDLERGLAALTAEMKGLRALVFGSASNQQAVVDEILHERMRQIQSEGWTTHHDDEHDEGELSAAASAYALAAADLLSPYSQGDGAFDATNPPPMWPDVWTWKPGEPRRMLIKAAALIAAEIERIDRPSPARQGAGSQG